MAVREAKIDKTLRSGFPASNGFSIREALLKNIDRGTKDMEIMKFAQGKSSLAPQIQWGESSGDVWKMVI